MIWRSYSIFRFLLSVIACSVLSVGHSPVAHAKEDCFWDLVTSITSAKAKVKIGSRYNQFKIYSDNAFEFYQSLASEERKVLHDITFLSGDTTPVKMRKAILDHIRNAPELSTPRKEKLIESLGVDSGSADQAIENFRRRYEYLFWTDHSETHMNDILHRSVDNAKRWPNEFVKPYRKILEDEVWKKRIEWSIRLHDSQMFKNRAMHAEMLLLDDEHVFPQNINSYEKNLVSVISMLHSKSLIPYSQLPRWSEALEKQIIPHLLDHRFLSPDRGAELKRWLRELTPEDREGIVKAASWIRMSDVDRPIGAGLKNSAGDYFAVDQASGEVYVEHAGEKVPVTKSQYSHIYGQSVLENIQIVPTKQNGFTAEFGLRLKGKDADALRKELNQLPILKWIQEGTSAKKIASYDSEPQLKSILYTIISIITDFPPNSFQSVRVIR